MRLGCGGCLGTLLVLAIVVVGVWGLVWGVVGVFEQPTWAAAPGNIEDGIRAQQKLYSLVQRPGSAGRATVGPVVLTEAELNAFLARHLGNADELPLTGLRVRLPGGGALEVTGRLPLRALLAEAPWAGSLSLLPSAWLDRPLWLRLRARARLDESKGGERRSLRLDVDRVRLGRTPLPAFSLRLILSPTALQLLRWPLPAAIGGVQVESGRVVIQSAS